MAQSAIPAELMNTPLTIEPGCIADHSRRDSRDDMELTCNRLFRSYAQEQLPVEDRDDVEVKRISLNGMRLSNGFVSDSSLPLNCGLLRTVDDPDHDAICKANNIPLCLLLFCCCFVAVASDLRCATV